MHPDVPYSMSASRPVTGGRRILRKYHVRARVVGSAVAVMLCAFGIPVITWLGPSGLPATMPLIAALILVLVLCYRPKLELTTIALTIRGPLHSYVYSVPDIVEVRVDRGTRIVDLPSTAWRERRRYRLRVRDRHAQEVSTGMFGDAASCQATADAITAAVNHYHGNQEVGTWQRR